MFAFLLPSKTKQVLAESELIQGSLHRNRVYAQDILSAKDIETVKALEDRYPALLKARDVEGLTKLNKEVMKLGNRLFPPSPWDGWKENVEVFVVAAIMALAIRTFFLQPFKIPTGSMEPTLYGIEPKPSVEPPPNYLTQAYEFLLFGKSYGHVVTKQGGKITGLQSGSFTIWLEYTDVQLTDDRGNTETDRIWIRKQDAEIKLGVYEYGDYDYLTHQPHTEVYAPGAVLANYVTQTGDQVLVDKVTYNFHAPRRGDVFIFKTAGIPGLADERKGQEGSEDFIKRCVGLAGDIVQVTPPVLLLNGKPADAAPSFAKEFAQSNSYPGYSLVSADECTGITNDLRPHAKSADGTPEPLPPFGPFNKEVSQTYYVPTDCYWAMGDNSPNSKDSRYWNGVPRQNLVGRGYFVFWPFTSRWGWIR